MATASAAAPARAAESAIGGKRRIIFPILAGLLAVVAWVLLDGVREGISPWSLHIDYDPQPELNKWHHASHGAAVGILFGGSMAALTWRSAQRPLLLWMYLLGFTTLGAVYTVADASGVAPFVVVIAVAATLLIAAYPDRRAFLTLPRPGASRTLLGLTALAAAGMAPAVIRAMTHVTDEPAFEGAADPARWGADIIICLVLVIGGLLVSSKRGGWLPLGIIIGIDFLYLGAAALTIPDQAGSWGTLGGVLSIAFALLWFGALSRERATA